jgi:archaeosortase B (VPXXXP-CTERM-specific)
MKKARGGRPGSTRNKASGKSRWIAVRSCLIFAATLGIWVALYPTLLRSDALGAFMEFDAHMTGSTLGVLGTRVDVSSTLISSPDFSMSIVPECTAIIPMVILTGAVLAYPSDIRQKLVCLAVGMPTLFLLNLARTVTLFYAGVHAPNFFDIAHYVIWQSAMVLGAVALWLFWAGRLASARAS